VRWADSFSIFLTDSLDNAIHCAAGPGLRNECLDFMNSRAGEPFPVGIAYLTIGYALPSKYVLHCVGPAAQYRGHEQPEELRACYHSCLSTSQSHGDIHSIAFCCISTGVFGYPAPEACEVAFKSVMEWLENNAETNKIEHIVFNVFTERDWEIYQSLGEKMFRLEEKEEEGEVEEYKLTLERSQGSEL
jgi:O-acetyl-ADP-ribose deacetylase (regulator of RNase III)